MPFSLRTLQKYFLIGSNTVLNIVTPLVILDHVASYFNLHEGTPEQQETTRLVIVGTYTALVLGMELISAERMTEEVMLPRPPAPGLIGWAHQERALNNLEGRHWHKAALVIDSFYKTIGKTAAAMMVLGKLNAGRLAATLTGLTLGVGGYLHTSHPPFHSDDIIHETNLAPGRSAHKRADFASTLFWLGTAASAVDNTVHYMPAYKMIAHEVSDAFSDSDAGSYLDENIFFLSLVLLGSFPTVYSKFLLARNRSAAIWEKHALAVDWREWFRLLDRWALLGAGAHSALSYCNDRVLTEGHVPDWLSLAVSAALPAASFLGTYATNADYSGWEVRNGILEYSPISPSGWGGNWQTLRETLASPLSEEQADVQPWARGYKPSDRSRSPSLIREAKGLKVITADERQPTVVAGLLPVADEKLAVTHLETGAREATLAADEKRAVTPQAGVTGGKSGENYGCMARFFARFRRPQQTVEPSARSPLLASTEASTPIIDQPSDTRVSAGGKGGLS
jgi:hypothetical protein